MGTLTLILAVNLAVLAVLDIMRRQLGLLYNQMLAAIAVLLGVAVAQYFLAYALADAPPEVIFTQPKQFGLIFIAFFLVTAALSEEIARLLAFQISSERRIWILAICLGLLFALLEFGLLIMPSSFGFISNFAASATSDGWVSALGRASDELTLVAGSLYETALLRAPSFVLHIAAAYLLVKPRSRLTGLAAATALHAGYNGVSVALYHGQIISP